MREPRRPSSCFSTQRVLQRLRGGYCTNQRSSAYSNSPASSSPTCAYPPGGGVSYGSVPSESRKATPKGNWPSGPLRVKRPSPSSRRRRRYRNASAGRPVHHVRSTHPIQRLAPHDLLGWGFQPQQGQTFRHRPAKSRLVESARGWDFQPRQNHPWPLPHHGTCQKSSPKSASFR